VDAAQCDPVAAAWLMCFGAVLTLADAATVLVTLGGDRSAAVQDVNFIGGRWQRARTPPRTTSRGAGWTVMPQRQRLDTGRCWMKAIMVTDQAAGMAGMTLAERPVPEAAGNDVLVEVHASGFTPGELSWPSNWTDRLGRDRTPSIPGHELAGVVSALGYGTTGLSLGQRVFGLTDWTRDGTLAE